MCFVTEAYGIRQELVFGMPLATSPLRYPGGKICLLESVARILRMNKLEHGTYAEPYAGGCGLALALLFDGHVSDIHINDIDLPIWSFWSVVLDETEDFIRLMELTKVTLHEWHKQRRIFRESQDKMELAFAAFFLNRTNRSGIIKNAGVIGGLDQTGRYTVNCRFNKEELARRIRRIRRYRSQIHLHRWDALRFLDHAEKSLPPRSFLNIDPPYYHKGSSLYTSYYVRDDHEKLADRILQLGMPWILTYDYCDEINKLYTERRQFQFALNYSVQTKRKGSELLIASKGLRIPEDLRHSQVHKPQYRTAA